MRAARYNRRRRTWPAILALLAGVAAVLAAAIAALLLLPVHSSTANDLDRPGVDQAATESLCAPADAARKVLEVLGYDPMWIACDAGQVQTGVIFIHRWNLTRLRVACLDGRAELFRRAE